MQQMRKRIIQRRPRKGTSQKRSQDIDPNMTVPADEGVVVWLCGEDGEDED